MTLNANIHLKPKDLQPGEHVLSRAEIEQQLGHTLPSALKDLLPSDGAPASFEEDVRIKVIERNPITDKDERQRVSLVFGMTSGKNGIVTNYNAYQGRFARRSTPFAEDGMGNLFVIDAVSGQVKFWHHECSEGEASPTALTLVAKDFEAFVSGLEAVQEEHDPELLRGVKKATFDF